MATTNETNITITSSGDGLDGSNDWSPTPMTNSYGAAGGPVAYSLTAGDNTLPVPTGAMGMAFAPPLASAAVVRLKHYAGETGFAIRSGQPVVLPLPTGSTSVLLNSSEGVRVLLHWL